MDFENNTKASPNLKPIINTSFGKVSSYKTLFYLNYRQYFKTSLLRYHWYLISSTRVTRYFSPNDDQKCRQIEAIQSISQEYSPNLEKIEYSRRISYF